MRWHPVWPGPPPRSGRGALTWSRPERPVDRPELPHTLSQCCPGTSNNLQHNSLSSWALRPGFCLCCSFPHSTSSFLHHTLWDTRPVSADITCLFCDLSVARASQDTCYAPVTKHIYTRQIITGVVNAILTLKFGSTVVGI